MKTFIFLWLCFAALTARSAEPPVFLCTSTPMQCTPIEGVDKFDAQVQRMLAERQLAKQPRAEALYILLPMSDDDGALKETQIRYLEELLARERAKSK